MNIFKKAIYKSKDDKKIDGVCGGLAETLEIDSTWIRLFFVIFTIATGFGTGLLAYLALTIVLKESKDNKEKIIKDTKIQNEDN